MVYNGKKRERDKDIDDLDKTSSITLLNVPYAVRWEEVRDICTKEVGEVIFVKMFKDDNNRATGAGYVTFDTPRLAEIAKSKLDRYKINDREIVVKDASFAERFTSPRGGLRDEFRSKTKRPNHEEKPDLRRRLQPTAVGRSGGRNDKNTQRQARWKIFRSCNCRVLSSC